MGYETASLLVGGGGTSLVARLVPAERALDEVTVRAALPQVEQAQTSMDTVPVAIVRAMPSFMGEPDVMEAITFLPGILPVGGGRGRTKMRQGGKIGLSL